MLIEGHMNLFQKLERLDISSLCIIWELVVRWNEWPLDYQENIDPFIDLA